MTAQRIKMSHKKVHINITPLVDVMLVLLIIFMITSPMMHSHIDLDLPKTKSALKADPETAVISMTKNGTLYLNEKTIKLDVLKPTLQKLISPKSPIIFKADKAVPYEKVFEIINTLVDAGYSKISLTAEQK